MNSTEKKEETFLRIQGMREPLSSVPFDWVIEAISGHKIIPFDLNEDNDKKLLFILKKVAQAAGQAVNKTGIIRPRPNEVGNDIEQFVIAALKGAGLNADVPKTASGNKKTTGYPDIWFADGLGGQNYLECKTFSRDNADTTLRSFYVSPAKDFKVTMDARHIGISYEVYEAGKQGKKNIYKCRSWKLIALDRLKVDVKFEFNSNNHQLYSDEMVLTSGIV